MLIRSSGLLDPLSHADLQKCFDAPFFALEYAWRSRRKKYGSIIVASTMEIVVRSVKEKKSLEAHRF